MATTAAEPASSFISRAVEPVTLATARMRTAVSRLAASSSRLSSANSTRLQTGDGFLKELP
jgi:division protein CdvB (Snf7/Vps24/ESCRT-III family)